MQHSPLQHQSFKIRVATFHLLVGTLLGEEVTDEEAEEKRNESRGSTGHWECLLWVILPLMVGLNKRSWDNEQNEMMIINILNTISLCWLDTQRKFRLRETWCIYLQKQTSRTYLQEVLTWSEQERYQNNFELRQHWIHFARIWSLNLRCSRQIVLMKLK